jgi:shikimate kinase
MSRPPVRRYRNIFLVGLPGVGKSTFGQTYAVHSSRSFYDLDRTIESEQGRTIAEIFADKEGGGERHFREIEHHALQKLAKRQNVVVSLGGGAVCSDDALQILKEHGLVVCLTESFDELARRLFAEREKRPMFAEFQTQEEVQQRIVELFEQRKQWYSKAHLSIDFRFSSLDAAKIELSSYERCAFRKNYLHELELMGVELPAAPDLQVHPRPRYVLRERPYLASLTEGSSSRGGKTGSGRTKKSGTAGKTKRPRPPKSAAAPGSNPSGANSGGAAGGPRQPSRAGSGGPGNGPGRRRPHGPKGREGGREGSTDGGQRPAKPKPPEGTA